MNGIYYHDTPEATVYCQVQHYNVNNFNFYQWTGGQSGIDGMVYVSIEIRVYP